MSTLTGHYRITKQALIELSREHANHPAFRALPATGMHEGAVARDIIDVLCLGHWLNFGQSHHFMKRFDGQSDREAYDEAIEWIRSNALLTVRAAAGMFPKSRGLVGRLVINMIMSEQGIWMPLAYAVHCVEDSFARGHTAREASNRPGLPGDIVRVKVYQGDDKHNHEEDDEAWSDKKDPSGFSVDGRLAVNAVKDLIFMVLISIIHATDGPLSNLIGFREFREKWLRASLEIGAARDPAIELIERFASSLHTGLGSVTANMDEKKLAAALYGEVGTNLDLVEKVFDRLSKFHQTDVDDVAEYYVNMIRSQGGAVKGALKARTSLKNLLIKSLDDGWTSSGEKECIDFLKAL